MISPFAGLSPFAHARFSAGGISNFNDISGCIVQCLAHQLTGFSPGDPVSSIPDTSTLGTNPMNGVLGVVSPTYEVVSGKPVVRFLTGSGLFISGTMPLPMTVLARARITAPIATRIISANGTNWLLGWWNGAMEQAYFNGVLKLDGTPTTDFLLHTVAATLSGSFSELFWDGSSIATSGSANTPPTGLGVNAFTIEQSNCEFVGLVVYDSVLSGTDLTNATTLMNTL